MDRASGCILLLALFVCLASPFDVATLPRDARSFPEEPKGNPGELAVTKLPSDSAVNRWTGSETRLVSHADGTVPLEGRFLSPHADFGLDMNDNGLYDFLVVQANVTVDTPDTYKVEGRLTKEDTTLDIYNETSAPLDPGEWTVFLFYDGPSINASDVDGPYSVGLVLRNSSLSLLDTALHTTQAYNHTDFDTVTAEFSPPHFDTPVDTDADGRFNVLNMHVNVAVHVAAEYYVNAVLYDATYNLTLFSSASETLDPGPRTFVLSFPGDLLNATGIDGPYLVSMSLFILPTFTFIDRGDHVTAAYNHTQFEEPTVLTSTYAGSPPMIDGEIGAAEWAGAREVDLAAVPGNDLRAFLLVMNDNGFLYVGLDAVGDTTAGPDDTAAIAFDTGDDGRGTVGDEDEFVQGGWAPNGQAHYVYAGDDNWTINDSPFNPRLPNQEGLAGAQGFGRTPKSSSDHRTYEFKIPLPLLGARPGGVLGFVGGSHLAPWAPWGVFDNETSAYSMWPERTLGPIPLHAYGDLILAAKTDTVDPTIAITSPLPDAILATRSITIEWDASDDASGLNRFDVRVDDRPPVIVRPPTRSYMATGLGDGPHTFNVTAHDAVGNSRSAVVRVTVDASPPSLELDAPESGYLGTGTFAVSWTAADAGSGLAKIEVTVDGGTPTSLPPTARSHTLSAIPDGPHEIRVKAIDVAGNSASGMVAVTIDTAPPEVAITSPARAAVIPSTELTVSFTKDDASGIDRIEISLDSGPSISLGTTATSHRFTGLSEGDHHVDVTVSDQAGNSRTASVTFRVDTAFFSPSGPFGFAGIGVVAAVLVGLIVAAIAITRRGRRGG